jgi:hypothetical protein
MQEKEVDREARLRELASELFSLSKLKALSSRCTEMSMYRNPCGTKASPSPR